MTSSRKEKANTKVEQETCRSCKRIEWVTFVMPRKLHSFIYSKRNLFIAIIVAVIVYFLASGQPEMVRRVVPLCFCSWLLGT